MLSIRSDIIEVTITFMGYVLMVLVACHDSENDSF